MSPADQIEIIRWQLKHLISQRDELSPNDLEWAIRMEESFKRKGFLTERETEVLENIYRRY